jgi:hypothetical protein
MRHRHLLMPAGESGLELQDAAGIAGGDHVDFKLRHKLGFAIAEGFGGVGLNEIVNSCGAAADGGFWNFGKFEIRNAGEQGARLRADALRVLQMTGVVKRNS